MRGCGGSARTSPDVRRFGSLELDVPAREARLDGRPLDLTRIEFDLLDTLTSEPRVAFTRQQLLDRVWGPNWYGDDHLVDVHVSNLRRKLADDPRDPDFVCTVRGVGYRMGAGR
jgi:DNA-binding response OmpR family regulator